MNRSCRGGDPPAITGGMIPVEPPRDPRRHKDENLDGQAEGERRDCEIEPPEPQCYGPEEDRHEAAEQDSGNPSEHCTQDRCQERGAVSPDAEKCGMAQRNLTSAGQDIPCQRQNGRDERAYRNLYQERLIGYQDQEGRCGNRRIDSDADQ